jgi:hypothetical protein
VDGEDSVAVTTLTVAVTTPKNPSIILRISQDVTFCVTIRVQQNCRHAQRRYLCLHTGRCDSAAMSDICSNGNYIGKIQHRTIVSMVNMSGEVNSRRDHIKFAVPHIISQSHFFEICDSLERAKTVSNKFHKQLKPAST